MIPRRKEFPPKTRLAAWRRAGGPDAPICECGCGQPITRSDPAEYHHHYDRDDQSLENCRCVRSSCHKRLTREETLPKIKRSRRQERMAANVKTKGRPLPGSRRSGWKHRLDGTWERRDEP